MDNELLFIIAAVAGGLFLYKKRQERVRELEEKFFGREYGYNDSFDRDDLIKGYKLAVTPKITTRLKVLKLRHKVFRTESEAGKCDFRMDEAIPLAETKTWDELGMRDIGRDIDRQLNSFMDDKAWTDIGMMKPDRLELYFLFLERFRLIIENKSLSLAERVKRVQKMEDNHGFLRRLKKEYGEHFPKNLFIGKLTKIDGVSPGIAYQFFDMGIYSPEEVQKLSKEELIQLKGVGKVRLEKITNYLNKHFEIQ